MIRTIIEKYSSKTIALYGLGTETERFLKEYGNQLSVVGLLDGFKTEGEIYGYPIISIEEIASMGVELIIVVARPGSCKAIAKRIGNFCRENNIALFDVRGKDLLDVSTVTFDFKNVIGDSRQMMLDMIDATEVISFDLFDTLVMRKTKEYTDVFDLIDYRLKEQGIYITDFCKLRLFSEKELSKNAAPKLGQIYNYVLKSCGENQISASELAELEWKIDCSLLTARESVKEIFLTAISNGKKVVITTDSYYSKPQIGFVLKKFGLTGYDELFVSCEYGTSKTQGLFDVLKDKYNSKSILHIGDDEYADVEKAQSSGLKTFRLYSANDLFDSLGGLEIEEEIKSISDRVKLGLFLANIFNSPFWFEDDERRLAVRDAYDIGYLFCAPVISDFTLWLKERITKQCYKQILFGSRDGYLVEKLYKMVDESKDVYYFMTSRTAAIRAGMSSREDIDYVDSMKYFGTQEEAMKERFGIDVLDANAVDRMDLILQKSQHQRNNYHKYIRRLGLDNNQMAFFDFVAKGTTQLYLQKLFVQHVKGFYFLQLEPEFMANKKIDIEPFYLEEEKNTSAIFDNYYILETMLTAPHPQVLEMDEDGNPIYAMETRNEKDLQCFERAQNGIVDYFKAYLDMLPEAARTCNKKIDERFLALVNKVMIIDKDFLSLIVEDPFFGRMTDIKDVL